MLELYEDDDATLVTDLEIAGFEAGADSDTLSLHLWNDKGNSGGTDLYDVLLILEAEDPARPGVWIRSGVAPLDELWPACRVVGQDNTDRPEQQAYATAWTPLGASGSLLIPNILAGAARYLELRFHPPSTATATTWRFRLGGITAEASEPLPAAFATLAAGVLPGIGPTGWSGLVRGGAVTATGTPDDEVHVAAAQWTSAGVLLSAVSSSLTLDQNDSAAAALGVGEMYRAVISLGPSGAVATKGVRGVDPARPAAPAGNVPLAVVEVAYGASGSVIDAADLTDLRVFDRLYAVAGTGLELVVHSGQALCQTWRYRSRTTSLVLPGSATRYVWQLPSGLLELTATTAPPVPASLLLWEVETDATDVINLIDHRVYARPTVVLTLFGAPAVGSIASLVIQQRRLYVERWMVVLSDGGSGGGTTRLDYEINGSTAHPSSATDDQRPAFASGATTLTADDGYPELIELRRGDVLELVGISTSGTPPGTVTAYFLCWEA